jgi:hypothetical protein
MPLALLMPAPVITKRFLDLWIKPITSFKLLPWALDPQYSPDGGNLSYILTGLPMKGCERVADLKRKVSVGITQLLKEVFQF